MAEKTTLARPYAKAAFELAFQTGRLQEWSNGLAFAALVAEDPQMVALVRSPRITKERAAELFIELGGERLNADVRNFIRTLAENRRLGLLPEIAVLFEQYRAEAERTVEVHLIAAAPVSDEQRQKFAASLKERLKRNVELKVETDPSLLGGAVIRAGDMVIDGSVRGRLSQLAAALGR